MDDTIKTALWNQFGAAIDMLDDAITACPDALWTAVLWDDPDDPRYGQVWFIAYHVLMWLDLYLDSASRKAFVPPAPFLNGRLPDAPYPRTVIQAYLQRCREKCRRVILGLTAEKANEIQTFDWGGDLTFLELQLYCMRHVQEHSSQLHYLLGRHGIAIDDWLSLPRDAGA